MQHLNLRQSTRTDLPEVLALQKQCYQLEAAIYSDYRIQPLIQTLDELYEEIECGTVCFVACREHTVIGSVRGYVKGTTGYINKLMVTPEYQNRGIGKQLMQQIEMQLRPVSRYELFTGSRSEKNLSLYQKLGYTVFREQPVHDRLTLVFLHKQCPAGLQASFFSDEARA